MILNSKKIRFLERERGEERRGRGAALQGARWRKTKNNFEVQCGQLRSTVVKDGKDEMKLTVATHTSCPSGHDSREGVTRADAFENPL